MEVKDMVVVHTQELVEEFHKKYGFSYREELKNHRHIEVTDELRVIGHNTMGLSNRLKPTAIKYQELGDDRLYRIHLILEELAELSLSLAERNIVDTADALADIKYVVEGTAVAYDIPMREVFEEVHRSNMTKTRTYDDPRMKRKGLNYVRPNIVEALEAGWQRQWEQDNGNTQS